MQQLRLAQDRGHAHYGWLKTYYSFSFADYFDPEHMGFGTLRVINDDTIAPHSGFARHGHRDMEIITYMRSGELTHEDSLGHRSSLSAGQVQCMSAGRGIEHSEYNHGDDTVSLLQIWIEPDRKGLSPSYHNKTLNTLTPGVWRLLVSPDGRDDSLVIHQDALLLEAKLELGSSLSYQPQGQRRLYVHVLQGELEVGQHRLASADALKLLSDQPTHFRAHAPDTTWLLFDLSA